MNKLFLIVLAFGFFLAGCASQQATPQSQQPSAPPAQYLCPDGVNVVANLASCPPYDKEYEECLDMSATSDYGSSDRDACFYSLALERENISLCKKVTSSDSYYDEYTQSNCGAQLALAFSDPTMCEQLGIIGKYDCYSELASQLEDASMCDFINSTQKKDDCLYDYLYGNSYYIEDWSFCEKFSEQSSNKDYCYYEAATNTYDVTYCDKIEGKGGLYYGYSMSGCYAAIATMEEDPTICSQLDTTPLKDECYYDYATSYPYDDSVCNSIVDSNKKSSCIRYTNDTYDYY
ncbi:MAG: hypothetical protein PHF60_00615 [Candidatus ainarchaeum sp.]|nr:hypothetical protein [Candidatus ainarchaeum sp.]